LHLISNNNFFSEILWYRKKEINCKNREMQNLCMYMDQWNSTAVFLTKSNANIFQNNTDRSYCNPDITCALYFHFYSATGWEAARALSHCQLARRANVKFGRGTRAAFFHLVTRAIWRSPTERIISPWKIDRRRINRMPIYAAITQRFVLTSAKRHASMHPVTEITRTSTH